MTCAKVAINGPNLKKLAHTKNQIGESGGERKKNPSANPVLLHFDGKKSVSDRNTPTAIQNSRLEIWFL